MQCVKGKHHDHVVINEFGETYEVICNVTLNGYVDYGYFLLRPCDDGRWCIVKKIITDSKPMK